MKNSTYKDVLLGIAMALVAAYVYSILLIWNTSQQGVRTIMSIFGGALELLLFMSWLVIPLGVMLGILIPKMVYNKTRWMAALQGAAIGIVAALMVMSGLWVFFGVASWSEAVAGFAWMAAYCAVWTSTYAFIRARRNGLYR